MSPSFRTYKAKLVWFSVALLILCSIFPGHVDARSSGGSRSSSRGSRPSISRPSNNRPSNNRPSNNRPSNNRPSNSKPSNTIHVPSINRPSNSKPSNNIHVPSINIPSNNIPSVNKPSNNKPSHNIPSINKPSHNFPSLNKPSHNIPSINKPSHNIPSINKPSHNIPSINKPSFNSYNKPAVDWNSHKHTSSYKPSWASSSFAAGMMYSRLPKRFSATSILYPISRVNRRLTTTERVIVWGMATWTVRRAQRRLGRYLRYRCRIQVNTCHSYLEGYHGYCDYYTRMSSCLSSGCSLRESAWLRHASCAETDELPTLSTGNYTDWVENEPFRLSLNMSREACRDVLEQCRQNASNSTEGSYCSLLYDQRDCIITNSNDTDGCSTAEWDTLADAACTRTVLNFEEEWNAPQELILATAVTSERCQINIESCKEAKLDTVNSYCELFQYKGHSPGMCGAAGSSGYCTAEEWEGLQTVACASEQEGGGGAGNVVSTSFGVILASLLSLVSLM